MKHLFLASIFVATACNADGMTTGDRTDNEAESPEIGAQRFECPQVQGGCSSAADIRYDNAGSRLADNNVQGAIDELAARAEAPTDPFFRVEIFEESIKGSPASTGAGVTASCPRRGDHRGRALGGACGNDSDSDDVHVYETRLDKHDYACVWSKPLANEATFTATVTCLMPPE